MSDAISCRFPKYGSEDVNNDEDVNDEGFYRSNGLDMTKAKPYRANAYENALL